jgi:hypothetical protein
VRRKDSLTVVANLAAFGVCACIAFARNSSALFYHYDGAYMLVEARNQLTSTQPLFEFSNDFLQSTGNIQFAQNARLLFFLWPMGWFSDLRTAKITTYLVIAAVVFLSAYKLGRLLSQPRTIALTAGWILGFIATPIVPKPFFYDILSVAPAFVVVAVVPIASFWLISHAGRSSSMLADAANVLGLIALVFYILAAVPIFIPVLALGTAVYVVLAILLAQSRSELWRKLCVLVSALFVIIVLRWPWYVFGLFLYTAPNIFPNDFTAVYNDKLFASILFHAQQIGFAGPILVALSVAGAVFSLRSATAELRAAAWVLLASVAGLFAAGIALSVMPHWIFPPTLYFEIAVWPLYGVFSAIALHRIPAFLVERFAPTKLWAGNRARPQVIVLILAFAIAAAFAITKSPTPIGYPFPPRATPVVTALQANIALHPLSQFNGRMATIIPITADAGDAWAQQSSATTTWARTSGNDEMSVGVWYYQIPTLFEYNQFISPVFHALIKRALQRPPIAHQRNITVLTYPDTRVLKLLGVRYLLTPQPDAGIGELRVTEERVGGRWGLIELSEPNLATYSPTLIETRHDLASTLDFIVDHVDLAKRAVTREEIDGVLVPLSSSALSMSDGGLRVVAESAGRSLVVVPIEFSHCIELRATNPGMGTATTLLRIDGVLTGILFDSHLDAVLSFRYGPLHNPLCRWQDYRELQSMLR